MSHCYISHSTHHLYMTLQEAILSYPKTCTESTAEHGDWVVSEGRVGPRPAVQGPRPTQISIQRCRSIPSPLKKNQKNIYSESSSFENSTAVRLISISVLRSDLVLLLRDLNCSLSLSHSFA